MNKTVIILFLLLTMMSYGQKSKKQPAYIDYNKNQKMDVFEDSSQPIDKRVEDLLKQMTFQEKQGQLLMDLGWQYYQRTDNKISITDYARQTIQEKKMGALWGFFRADPWSGKTLDNGITPFLSADGVNQLQRYMIDSTRLGIPMFIAEECMHGIMQVGSVVYPTGLGQASTWNKLLIRDMAADIRNLAISEGINICFSPLVDIARDPRWSRVEETYGEDSYLTSEMGAMFVEGLVNQHGNYKKSVLPTLKHFAAYGISEGGHNAGSAHIGLRELHSDILPPFKKAIQAGAQLVMTAYNEIDGIPCSMNPYLLQDVLRNRWGFDGIVISDLHSISGLRSHGVAKDLKQAAEKSINAGLDLDLSATDFYNNLSDVDINRIDEAVRRILYKKFECGLFDEPFIKEQTSKETAQFYNNSLTQAAEVAKESIVLLKNNNNILPLDSEKPLNIALIGPNADNMYNMLGDYTGPQGNQSFYTIRGALDSYKMLHKNIKFTYSKGCSVKDTNKSGFNDAVKAAQNSDVILLCLGGSSSRYETIEYENTGAAKVSNNTVSDITSGEGFDRSSLELAGVQKELLEELKKTNKPIILILVNGRPLVLTDIKDKCDAILECFYPGQMGANAIIATVFGENNPSGRLPISFPSDIGALPCYYNTKRVSNRSDYLEGSAKALYPFGFGLSYTEFKYGNFSVKVNNNGTDNVNIDVRCDVTNTGSRDGSEVVQVYVKKLYSDYATNEINLWGFDKKFIKSGDTQTFTVNIDNDSFREWNATATEFYLSKGEYEISIRKDAFTVIDSHVITIE
ncbi:MAG: glycoside hydrolase family 3 C-terminal domain-containing protein [Bacteroidales bacterium]|nr:glycoside hydrolase family 3 C-terminal domain-containing protein [Bacteroidales bacterium]